MIYAELFYIDIVIDKNLLNILYKKNIERHKLAFYIAIFEVNI
jgi:hypothetical protein